MAFLVYSAYVCANQFKPFSWIFVMALMVGLVVWIKVSTDIFLYFAICLCAAVLQKEPNDDTVPKETEKTVVST